MNKSREKREDLIPVNCFWVGGSFLDYCVKQSWMAKQREGRSTRYYCTLAGVEALRQFGIEILRPEEKEDVPVAQAARPNDGPRMKSS